MMVMVIVVSVWVALLLRKADRLHGIGMMMVMVLRGAARYGGIQCGAGVVKMAMVLRGAGRYEGI